MFCKDLFVVKQKGTGYYYSGDLQIKVDKWSKQLSNALLTDNFSAAFALASFLDNCSINTLNAELQTIKESL